MTDRELRDPPVAIIFDLDGVLTDTAHAHATAWQKLANRHHITVDAATLDRLRGRSRADSLAYLLGDTPVTNDEFEAMLAEKNGYYLDAISTLTPADLLPGAREAVTTARTLGACTAVGSASKNAALVLERLAIATLFDTVVDGTHVTRAKPDPAVFLLAAARLTVPPQRCAVIEDAASGIAAANQAGMFAIGLGAHVDPADCALHLNNLTELDVAFVLDRLEQTDE